MRRSYTASAAVVRCLHALPLLLLLTSEESVLPDVLGRQQGLHLQCHAEEAPGPNCSGKEVCQAVLTPIPSRLAHTGIR